MGGPGSGRKPHNSAFQRAAGRYQTHPSEENKYEPKPNPVEPPKPLTVSSDPVASKKWDYLVNQIRLMGFLAESDADLLEVYCVTFARYRDAERAVKKYGLVIEDDDGNVKRNPAAVELRGLIDRLVKMLSELGLSPSARTKLVAAPVQESDALFDYLSGKMPETN